MAQFVEVIKEAGRMCQSFNNCEDGCPAYDDDSIQCCLDLSRIETQDIDYLEGVVMKWAAESPKPRYPTWKEWQETNFPGSHSRIRPCHFMSDLKCPERCCPTNCEHYCDEQIPAHIAEKLGIKPIEGGTK